MTNLRFMPFYWSDFLGDTMHLTGLESGVYAMLLGQMWLKSGWIQDDDTLIAKMCRVDMRVWKAMRPKIDPLLRHKRGRISQKRLLDELRKAKRIAAKNQKRSANFAPHNEKKRRGKSAPNQTVSSLSDGHARARYIHNHNNTPPDGGDSARTRARPPKERTINDVLNEMQGKDAADDEYLTIEASVERRHSERSADIVQFHAFPKGHGS
jgi:uncharacterized protein YdaU (DUF1376 family)